MLHTWPTQFYVGPPTLTFLAMLVQHTGLVFIDAIASTCLFTESKSWRNIMQDLSGLLFGSDIIYIEYLQTAQFHYLQY